jgi:hypothetical protein
MISDLVGTRSKAKARALIARAVDCDFESHLGYIDVCQWSLCIASFVGRGLATSWSPTQGVLRHVVKTGQETIKVEDIRTEIFLEKKLC